MLRVNLLLIAGLTIFVIPRLQADCVPPEEVAIPDGTSSTYEEMKDGQAFVKEYMAEMETYLDCLSQEPADEQDEQSGEKQESLQTQRRHAAIDAMESVAARFNEQVRAFKKANP